MASSDYEESSADAGTPRELMAGEDGQSGAMLSSLNVRCVSVSVSVSVSVYASVSASVSVSVTSTCT